VLTTLAAAHTKDLRADRHSTASALTGGFHLAFGIATGLLAAAFILALTILRQPKAAAHPEVTATAEETTTEVAPSTVS
jgi:hypothetical protein